MGDAVFQVAIRPLKGIQEAQLNATTPVKSRPQRLLAGLMGNVLLPTVVAPLKNPGASEGAEPSLFGKFEETAVRFLDGQTPRLVDHVLTVGELHTDHREAAVVRIRQTGAERLNGQTVLPTTQHVDQLFTILL